MSKVMQNGHTYGGTSGGGNYSAGEGIDIDNGIINAQVDDDTIHIDGTTNEMKVDSAFRKEFIGTQAEWDALTSEQQNVYEKVNITDDNDWLGNIDATPTENSENAVSSGGVYDALQEKANQTDMDSVEDDIADIQAVIPSGASSSNQLVASNSIGALSYITDGDCNDLWEQGKTKDYLVGGSTANQPDTNHAWYITSFSNTSQLSANHYVYQIARSTGNNADRVEYVRGCYLVSGTHTWTAWKKILDTSDLTSSVTSGSTAPVTSGGVWTQLNRTTLKDWSQTTGSALLYNCAFNWGLSVGATVICELVAVDANSLSDNYHGIVKYVYGGSGAISGFSSDKLAGSGTISATNSGGTVEFNFANGNPKVVARFIGTV